MRKGKKMSNDLNYKFEREVTGYRNMTLGEYQLAFNRWLQDEVMKLSRPTEPKIAELESLAIKVIDGSVLIPNIIVKQFRVKDDDSSYADCKVIDEQRQFFNDLYLLLSHIIDVDPELLTICEERK